MTALAGLLVAAAVAVVGLALSPTHFPRVVDPPDARGVRSTRRRTGFLRRRRHGRRRERAIDRAFPDMLDLFVVTVQSGHGPLDAIRSLRLLVHPLIDDVLERVLDRVERGERFVDALEAFTDALGPRGSTFVDTLTMTERSGLPLAPAVDRLADEARQHRRRIAESDAFQLPVRLSFPLVLCTLTSFVLVAIVPLLLGTLPSLETSSP